MSLKQQICLDVGIIKLGGLQLVGQPGGQVTQQTILAVTDRQILVFGGSGYNLDQTANFCFTVITENVLLRDKTIDDKLI